MSLALPITPDNLVTQYGRLVESDTYHIAERIRKEVSPSLIIYQDVTDDGRKINGIVERCVDGVDRFVCWHQGELDQRVIDKLKYMLHVPFEHRLAEAEKIEAANEAQRLEDEKNQLVEQLGLPMLPELERCGFIQRNKSYPKFRGGRRR